jgi:hypothetical protein
LEWNGPIWQRNYYERVLRDGKELDDASRYIAENPMKWAADRENRAWDLEPGRSGAAPLRVLEPNDRQESRE